MTDAVVITNASAIYPLLRSPLIDFCRKIAHDALQQGWRMFVVGGAVRDAVMGKPLGDIDLECFGNYTPAQLRDFLSRYGGVEETGKSFQVYKLHIRGAVIDVAIPRTETKEGKGHKGFGVRPDPTIPMAVAVLRRDYTANALMYSLTEDAIYDFTGGVRDIESRILRHAGEAFADDVLRVLRGFRFVSRFGMQATDTTIEMCRSLLNEYTSLPKERIWGEWLNWAKTAEYPSRGLLFLKDAGWLSLYPPLAALVTAPYPVGIAWQHTLLVVDKAVQGIKAAGVSQDSRVQIVFAALLHDVGARGALSFLESIGATAWVTKAVLPLVEYHALCPESRESVRRLAKDLHPATLRQWAILAVATGESEEKVARVVEIAQQESVLNAPPSPVLQGRHLVEMGIQPGPIIGEIVKKAYEAQLAGEITDIDSGQRWVAAHYSEHLTKSFPSS